MSLYIGTIILAGGNSERMNFPKPFLNYKGKLFIEKIVDAYKEAKMDKLIAVINKELINEKWTNYLSKIKDDCILVRNDYPERGRLFSTKIGIENIGDMDFCFIQNCDNPFIEKPILDTLMAANNPHGYTAPTYKGKGGHPILISKIILKDMLTTKDKPITLKDFLKKYPATKVELTTDSVLVNINTPKDYEKYINK